MSDQPEIQDSPAVPQGAQKPLARTDDPQYSRNANTVSQVFRSFPPAPEVQGASARTFSPNNANGAANRPSESVSGMACDSPVAVTVRPVDRKTIEGSYPGDSRAKAAPAVLPNQPAPRQPVAQTKDSLGS